MIGENEKAFSWAVTTLKNSDANNPLHKHSYNLLLSLSKTLLSEINDKAILEEYLLKLTNPTNVFSTKDLSTFRQMGGIIVFGKLM